MSYEFIKLSNPIIFITVAMKTIVYWFLETGLLFIMFISVDDWWLGNGGAPTHQQQDEPSHHNEDHRGFGLERSERRGGAHGGCHHGW